MVGQRYVTHHRHVAAADQPRIRDGMVGRATRAVLDQCRAVAGGAGDALRIRVVSMASVRVMAGTMVGSLRQHRGEDSTQSGSALSRLHMESLIGWPIRHPHAGRQAASR